MPTHSAKHQLSNVRPSIAHTGFLSLGHTLQSCSSCLLLLLLPCQLLSAVVSAAQRDIHMSSDEFGECLARQPMPVSLEHKPPLQNAGKRIGMRVLLQLFCYSHAWSGHDDVDNYLLFCHAQYASMPLLLLPPPCCCCCCCYTQASATVRWCLGTILESYIIDISRLRRLPLPRRCTAWFERCHWQLLGR
jgi:hypothetical protein